MYDYRLRYVDGTRRFIRSDEIHCQTNAEALGVGPTLRLRVRSDLWREPSLPRKFRPQRQVVPNWR
jgi:hypothetical protein